MEEQTIQAQEVAQKPKHKKDEKPSLTYTVSNVEYKLINDSDSEKLDTLLVDIENYVKSNDGQNVSEEKRDELWATANGMWKEYSSTLVNAELGFWLTRKEYNYLTDLIINKMEYDVNTVFVAIELAGFLSEMKKTFEELGNSDANTPINFKITAKDVTYLYHLIAGNKVKGLSTSAFSFAEILRKIGALSKVINHYDTLSKDYWTMIGDWTASFTTGEIN